MPDYEIVDQPPSSEGWGERSVADWDEIARTAVEVSPQWVKVPNLLRPHAQQIRTGKKASFTKYKGTWEAKTRKLPGDEGPRATIYIRYLP